MSQFEPGVHELGELAVEGAEADLRRMGWLVYALPGGIDSRRAFFAAIKAALHLDPPIIGDESWDALLDSLWEGLYQAEGSNVAIIWPRAALMAAKAPMDFRTAVDVLADVVASLGDPEATVGRPKKVAVLVAANAGPQSPSLS